MSSSILGSAGKISSSRSSNKVTIPPSSRLLFLAFLGISALLGGLLLSQFVPGSYVFGVLALVAACGTALIRWPEGGLLVIVVASVMPRFSVEIGGWNSRPEHYAVGIVLLILCFRWVRGVRPRIQLTSADCFLIAYLLLNYLSSALMSPEPKQTLRSALLTNLAIMPYFLIRFFVKDDRILRWAFKVFLATGILEGAYALVSFTSYHLFDTSFGVDVGQYAGSVAGVYGTHLEANFLGSYSGSLAIMLLVLYFLSDRRPAWLLTGLIVALYAMVASLARAALLSFAVVSILLAFLGLVMRALRPKKLLLLAGCLILFVPPIALTRGRYLAERITNLTEGRLQDDSAADTSAADRIVAWTATIGDIRQHPILGNGTASFQLMADATLLPILGDRPWVGNTPIRILHDTGLVGLLLFGSVFLGIAAQVKNIINLKRQDREIVIALSAGCLIYTFAFMATEGTMLSFFWVHTGLLASACSVPIRSRESGVDWQTN
jgi:O-antigen ligase